MEELRIEIANIKNIHKAQLSLPVEAGLYAIVGENATGKSTIMLALSQLVRGSSLSQLDETDFNEESYVKFDVGEKGTTWKYNYRRRRWENNIYPNQLPFDGFYEGSIFYGTRFRDISIAKTIPNEEHVCDADEFVKRNLSKILHDNYDNYKTLKRIKNRIIATSYKLEGLPYFVEVKGKLISQFKMSSGECMLISLLDFINNKVKKKNYKQDDRLLIFIDEVELALHPSAISRLVDFLNELSKEHDVPVYFSTHSAEIIRRILPRRIYQIENIDGNIIVNNPAYPSYVIRDLYTPDGFDYLILVEDVLAKQIVEKVLREENMRASRLIHVVPCGDWYNNLRLHREMKDNTVLGVGKKIISIIDGDVVNKVKEKKEFETLTKTFLPVNSLEKYIYKKIISEQDVVFIKYFGDKFFHVRSIKNIINDYKSNYNYAEDRNGKKLYDMLMSNLFATGIAENDFVRMFCDDLYRMVDFTNFKKRLENMLSR